MNNFNNLNEVPLADLSNNELNKLTNLEKELEEKYYLIAFDKNGEK